MFLSGCNTKMMMISALLLVSLLLNAGLAFAPSGPFFLAKQDFSLVEQQQGGWSNMSVVFDDTLDERHLFSRQDRQCVDPGYVPCPNMDKCCPAADTCQQSGCCRSGEVSCSAKTCYDPQTDICCENGRTCLIGYDCVSGGCCPTGQQPCGSSHCYHPSTEQCCKEAEERGCDKELTCCGQECCSKYAICRDGECEGVTCTVTSTYSITSFATQVNTVTKVREPEGEEDAPEFSCVPLTVTDKAGDTLELGDDCGLTFQPADAGPGDFSSSTTPTPTPTPGIKPRAPQADDTCLYTSTSVVTYTKNTVTTTTTTVTGEEPSQSFECMPMSVTNRVGDELSLDEECKLALSPASSSAVATRTSGGQPPGSNSATATASGSRALGPTGGGSQSATPTSEGMRLWGDSGRAFLLAVLVHTLSLIFIQRRCSRWGF